jgi:hypothetical protein
VVYFFPSPSRQKPKQMDASVEDVEGAEGEENEEEEEASSRVKETIFKNDITNQQ